MNEEWLRLSKINYDDEYNKLLNIYSEVREYSIDPEKCRDIILMMAHVFLSFEKRSDLWSQELISKKDTKKYNVGIFTLGTIYRDIGYDQYEGAEQLWEGILQNKHKFDIDKLKALLIGVQLYGDSDTYDQPSKYLLKLSMELLNIQSNDNVLLLGVGSGEVLEYHNNKNAKNGSTVIWDSDEDIISFAELRADAVDIPIITWDFISVGNKYVKFDKIYYDQMSNNSLEEAGNITDEDYLRLDNLINNNCSDFGKSSFYGLKYLTEGGIMIVNVSNNDITRKATKLDREFLIKNRFLKAVIKIPDKTSDKKRDSSTLLVIGFNNTEVAFIDATNIYVDSRFKGKRIKFISDDQVSDIIESINKNSKFSSIVPYDDIVQKSYELDPYLYTDEMSVEVPYSTLGELILEIQRGKRLTGEEIDNMSCDISDFGLLKPNSINDGFIVEFLPIKKINDNDSKFIAGLNDLVITKNGPPFKIAIIRDDNKYLVNENLYIIKTNDYHKSLFIKAYLENRLGQKYLEAATTGGKTKVLSLEKFKQISISNDAIDDMPTIVASYLDNLKSIEYHLKEIKKFTSINSELFSGYALNNSMVTIENEKNNIINSILSWAGVDTKLHSVNSIIDFESDIENILQVMEKELNNLLMGSDYCVNRNKVIMENCININKKGVLKRVGHIWPMKSKKSVTMVIYKEIVDDLNKIIVLPEGGMHMNCKMTNWIDFKNIDFEIVIQILSGINNLYVNGERK